MGEIQRALTPNDYKNMEFEDVALSSKFRPLLGDIELSGIWMVYGLPGNGKTSFCLQLVKELSKHARVAYNPLEEAGKKTFKKALNRNNMWATKVIFLRGESMADLRIRLKKQRAPKVVFIDSVQYTGLRKADIIKLQNDFPHVLFVFVSHADGRKPEGKVAQWLYFHGDITIHVDTFMAHPVKNRYEGKESFVIWKEGADLV